MGLDEAGADSSASATATTVPAAPICVPYPTRRQHRPQLSVPLPGHEARSRQDVRTWRFRASRTLNAQRSIPASGTTSCSCGPTASRRSRATTPSRPGRQRRTVGHEGPDSAERASAPATTNQNGSFRFFDARAPTARGLAIANALLGLFDDYTEFGTKPLTNCHRHGLRRVRPGQLEGDPQADAGARAALLAVAAVGRREQRHRVVPVGVLRSAPTPSTIDRAGGFVVPGTGDPLQRHRPARRRRRRRRRCSSSRSWPNCSGCITACRPGSPTTPKDGLQPRLGMAYAINDADDDPQRHRPLPEPPQINTTAAYGFNPPLSEMATVINGNVDAPGGASAPHSSRW